MNQFTGEYYKILYASYGVSIGMWWLMFMGFRMRLYRENIGSSFPQQSSWRGLIILFGAGVVTLLIGRLYSAGMLIPPFTLGKIRIGESINQLLIYSPFLVYATLLIRKKGEIWLPVDKWQNRILTGLVLSGVAVLTFTVLSNKRDIGSVLTDVYNIKNFHFAIQIFLEDLLIAMLLAAFNRAVGNRGTLIGLVVVSCLFAYGHLPSKLEEGTGLITAMTDLTFDALLGIGICYSILRSKDFLWFWPIHFAMDMMQFYSGV